MHRRAPRYDDAGDTLVELLIAMTIIAITVAGLLGGLATDIGSSGTHRGITNLDQIVRSFAEEARQIVQLDPSAQFKTCTTSSTPAYRMVSAPYPSIGSRSVSTSTQVTVFGTGFTPGGSISTVALKPASGTAVTVPSSTWSASTPTTTYGNTTVNFLVPSGLTVGTSYYVHITDSAGLQAISSVPFVQESTSTVAVVNPSPLRLYTLGITSVSYWNGTNFSATSCNPADSMSADLQQLTVTGTGPGVHDSYNVAVTTPIAFKGSESIPITYTGPASPSVGDTLTYTAAVNGSSGYSAYSNPTGTLTWYVVPPSGPTPSCSTSTWTLPGSTPTCSFKALAAGSYAVFAKYTGDSNYLSSIGQCPPTSGTCNPNAVGKGTSTTTVSGVSNGAAYQPTLTFTATVTGAGNTPSGSVTWAIQYTGNSFATTAPTCSPSTLDSSGKTTCTITKATPGNYQATATYAGDTNYSGSSGTSTTVNVPFLAPTIKVTDQVTTTSKGSTITITANVSGPSGDPTPTGTVTWTKNMCSSSTTSLDSSGNATCTIKNPASTGYFGTFTYAGDANYSSGSNPVNIPIATGGSTPGVGTLKFTLTIVGPLTGPTPGGTVTWTVTSGGQTVTCAPQTTATTPPNTAVFSCQVAGASPSKTYTASASYSGDSNYLPPYPDPTVIGPVPG